MQFRAGAPVITPQNERGKMLCLAVGSPDHVIVLVGKRGIMYPLDALKPDESPQYVQIGLFENFPPGEGNQENRNFDGRQADAGMTRWDAERFTGYEP